MSLDFGITYWHRFSSMITPSTIFSLTLVNGFLSIVTGISGGGGNFFCHRKPCRVSFGYVQRNLSLGAPCLKINYDKLNATRRV